MAFVIKYTTDLKTRFGFNIVRDRPYTDWKSFYKTDDAAVLLNISIFGECTIFWLPSKSLIYIRAFIGKNSCMIAHVHYTLNEKERVMYVDAVEVLHMDANNTTGLGSQISTDLVYFKDCFKRYFMVHERLTWYFFGNDEWRWDIAKESCEAIREQHVQLLNTRYDAAVALLNRPAHPTYYAMPDVYGIYDLSSVHKAASKIAAVFRGWKARTTYRMNPYTTLGRYLALRGFQELTVEN